VLVRGRGSLKHSMFASKGIEGLVGSRVIPDVAFHGIHICS